MNTIKMVPINEYVSLKMEVDRLNILVDDLTEELVKLGKQSASPALSQNIVVTVNGIAHVIKQSDIVMIKAESNYSYIHTRKGEAFFTSRTMKYWESKCTIPQLLRLHKSYLVNKELIVSYEPKTRSILLINDLVAYYSRTTLNIVKDLM